MTGSPLSSLLHARQRGGERLPSTPPWPLALTVPISSPSVPDDEVLMWLRSDTPMFDQVLRLRSEVFVVEQAVPEELEVDAGDAIAYHLAALSGPGRVGDKQAVIGTLRLIIEGSSARIGRLSVSRERRGRGLGRRLIEEALAEATRKGCNVAVLASQLYLIEFYQSMGFVVVSDRFLDAGILHVKMTLDLVVRRGFELGASLPSASIPEGANGEDDAKANRRQTTSWIGYNWIAEAESGE